MTFGERLSNCRKNIGFTQEQLANAVGSKAVTLSNWERNTREPDILMVMKLSQVLGVSSDYLIGIEKSPSAPISAEELSEVKDVSAELTELFIRCGFIKKREDFTDADVRFIRGVVELVATYFDKDR